jgi:hypothetical protein
MSDSEHFLSRWSRLKSEEKVAPGGNSRPTEDSEDAGSEGLLSGADDIGASFDASALPDVETIEARSDIRAFLAADVPNDLKVAALRRAWSSDPSIRDFIGLSEDLGDFNAPEAIIGFGPVEADRIQGLLERILAQPEAPGPDRERASAPLPEMVERARIDAVAVDASPGGPATLAPAPLSQTAETVSLSHGGVGADRSGRQNISQCDKPEVAAQQPDTMSRMDKAPRLLRRRHGSALPE